MNTSALQFARLTPTAVILLLTIASTGNAWQDDPFDPFGTDTPDVTNGADIFDQDNPAGLPLVEDLSASTKLLIRSVRESNPTTPEDLSRAIRTMLDIDQFGEARIYLNKLIGVNPNRQQMFELSEKLGPDFFLRLREQDELQPASRQFADRLFKLAREEAYSNERISRLISQLSDDNRFVRNDAVSQLRLLGAPAAAALLNVCGEENRRKEIPFIRAALKQMGNASILPLVAAARADGTVAQAVAVGALSTSKSQLAQDAILRTSVTGNVPDSVRELAADAVARRGLVSSYDIERTILERANEYLNGQVAIPGDGKGQVEIWNWNFAESKLVPSLASTENASRYLAIDMARDLYGLNPGNQAYRQLQLLTVLEGTKRVIGPNRSTMAKEITHFVKDFRAEDLDQLLNEAVERELWPAATAVAELAGEIGDASLVYSGNDKPRPLVNAILTGYRPLQFAAARSIAQIDPQQAYPGCSYVAQLMVMMATSDGRVSAAVMHPRNAVAQSLASSVFQSGLRGIPVSSAKQLFDLLESNPDIGLVMVTDASGGPHYQELVQQIRNYWLTQHLPVGLLVRDEMSGDKARLVLDVDPLTRVLPITSDPRLLSSQVGQLEELRVGVPVGNSQLDLHADVALEWLTMTLADPGTYRFYHLSCYRDRIGQLGTIAGSFEKKSKILRHLGTPESQRLLATLANDVSMTIDQRQVLAEAFNQSVRQHGLLMTRSEVKLQYDRYNASESLSAEVQSILGNILDTIELKTLGRESRVPGPIQ